MCTWIRQNLKNATQITIDNKLDTRKQIIICYVFQKCGLQNNLKQQIRFFFTLVHLL